MTVHEAVPAATLKVVQPGEGAPAGSVRASASTSRSTAPTPAEHCPSWSIRSTSGALVRPHVHTREDEISIVLEGEIGFRSEDQEVVLGAGGYIIKPRNQVHAMWNAGSMPARMIEIISPAGFEGFFRGFADLNDAGPIDPAAVAGLAEQYGLPYADPEWLPDDHRALRPHSTATAARPSDQRLTGRASTMSRWSSPPKSNCISPTCPKPHRS